MCISYRRYAGFLIRWKTFFVQCSYARAVLLFRGRRRSPVSPLWTGCRNPQKNDHLAACSMPSRQTTTTDLCVSPDERDWNEVVGSGGPIEKPFLSGRWLENANSSYLVDID